MSSRRSTERGAALVEILVAIAILGITSAALLGGVFTLARTSSGHSNHAKAEAVLTSAADALRDSSVTRVPCATPTQATYLAAVEGVTVPTGWTGAAAVDITSVQYWNGTGFGSTCHDTLALGNLLTLQLVTIAVTSPDGAVTETIAVVKA